MLRDLILQIDAPLFAIADRMLALRPNLTCAISNLRHRALCISDGRYKAIGEWIADEVFWNVPSRVLAPNPVRPRRKSQILPRRVETDHGRSRSIKQPGAYPCHQLVGQPVRNTEARSEVTVVRAPSKAIIVVGVFKYARNCKPDSCAQRIDCGLIEVRQSVESFRGRPLILVPQSSCNGHAVSRTPLILNVDANRMQAHSRIHLDIGIPAARSQQHGSNAVARVERVRAEYCLTRTARGTRFAGRETPAEIKSTRVILAIVHERYTVIGAEL